LFSLLLIVLFHLNFKGRLFGQYFSTFLFSLFTFYIFYFKENILTSKISFTKIKESLYFGLPLVPHVIGGVVINMSDRFFINSMCGKEELGIYNIGYLIGSAISIITISFSNAILPYIYSLLKIQDLKSNSKIIKIYVIYIFLLSALVFIIWLTTPFVFKYFIDSKFSSGSKYVLLVTIGYFFQGVYFLFINIVLYFNKTKILSYFSIFNILTNITLNYFLIKSFGAMGGAYATAISFFIFLIFIIIYSNKIYKLPWLFFFKRLSIG
jgi:O-antigen/teichoic acid export membrane protein